MEFVIKADHLAKEWAGNRIFENVSFELAKGEQVALFGRNGVGKTTLFNGLMNRTVFDHGTVWRRYPVEDWGWLEQHCEVDESITLLEFVRSGNPHLAQLKWGVDALQRQLENQSLVDHESFSNLNELAEAFSHLHEQYVVEEGYTWELSCEEALSRLGFQQSSWRKSFARLSGGEKTRAQVARLIVKQPKVLILDEPTNHIDYETLVWLKDWLRAYTGSVLFVSHDRQFIDQVADAVLELTPTGAKRYEGGYREFRSQRDIENKTHQALYDKQQQERKQIQEAIKRYHQWYQQAHDAAGIDFYARKKAEKNSTRFKAKERALERLEESMVDRPSQDSQFQLHFRDRGFEGQSLVRVHELSFQYGQQPLFRDLHLRIRRGDKIAIVGENGSGKSTLLKLLASELEPDAGEVERHPTLSIGYFAQELDDLDLSLSVLDTLLAIDGMTQSYARTVLAGFLFSGEEVFKRVGDLSMGERCRVAFVKLYFSGANLLVLDEPTNYLDVDARERIEEALKEYPGAFLIVSHDTYLVREVAKSILHLERSTNGSGTKVTYYSGTYDEYMASRRENADSIDIETRNQIKQLELQLANDMAMELPEDDEKRTDLMRKIRDTQSALNALRTRY